MRVTNSYADTGESKAELGGTQLCHLQFKRRTMCTITMCDCRYVQVLIVNQNNFIDESLRIFTARRNARIASAVLAMAIPSVRLSVCHTPVLCQND